MDMRVRTRANRVINHRGKNSANSLEKHARFPYNDMQMYLTTIPRGAAYATRLSRKQTEPVAKFVCSRALARNFIIVGIVIADPPPIEIHNWTRARQL